MPGVGVCEACPRSTLLGGAGNGDALHQSFQTASRAAPGTKVPTSRCGKDPGRIRAKPGPYADPRAGQILFAGFTSSGWLDQAPLVALRIEEDLKGPGSVALDAAYPLGTKGLGLSGGCSDV